MEPIVSITAHRPVETIDLVGTTYRVRRPKDIIAGPSTDAMIIAATDIAKARAGDETAIADIGISAIIDSTSAAWRYLKAALVDAGDYAAIRQRIAGMLAPEDAESTDVLTSEDNIDDNIDVDDLEQSHVLQAVVGLMNHWSSSRTVENEPEPTTPPPSAMAKATASANSATIRKRSK